MIPRFAVQHLNVNELLAEWRWLCSDEMILVARNAFADLFLCDRTGSIFRLDVSAGKLTKVADSREQFRQAAETREKLEEWFAESDERTASARGLNPNIDQCIGFAIPLDFVESGSKKNTSVVVDIYQQVAFLGDLHRQLSTVPNGTKVRLKVVP
jgi:hypothetical protein